MAVSTEQKAGIVQDFQRAAGDTGSPEVQVALLTLVSALRRVRGRNLGTSWIVSMTLRKRSSFRS
jgi:hypothetical protein